MPREEKATCPRVSAVAVEMLERRCLLSSNDIGGAVYDDTDRDGVWDDGDRGLPGVTVYLDLNENAQRDAAEPSSTTGFSGSYGPFNDLAYGTYHVRIEPPDNWVGDTLNIVTLQPGRIGLYNFLGYDASATMSFRLGVFNDADGDGVFDSGESRSPGRVVWIDADLDGQHDNGEPLAVTDQYGFADLEVGQIGTIHFRQGLPIGSRQTTPAGGAAWPYTVDRIDGSGVFTTPFGYQEIPAATKEHFDVNADRPTLRFEVINADVFSWVGQLGSTLVNLDTGESFEGSRLSFASERTTRGFRVAVTFDGFPNGILPDGNWRFTFPAEGAKLDGRPLAEDFVVDFFTLAGDANRDRAVNFSDFLTLRSHFGASDGALFRDGDFNYDDAVNFSDFLILRSQFGVTLAAPSATASLFADSGSEGDDDGPDVL